MAASPFPADASSRWKQSRDPAIETVCQWVPMNLPSSHAAAKPTRGVSKINNDIIDRRHQLWKTVNGSQRFLRGRVEWIAWPRNEFTYVMSKQWYIVLGCISSCDGRTDRGIIDRKYYQYMYQYSVCIQHQHNFWLKLGKLQRRKLSVILVWKILKKEKRKNWKRNVKIPRFLLIILTVKQKSIFAAVVFK